MELLLMSKGALTGMKHTHTLIAFIFLGFFFYKAFLLLTNKEEQLDKVRNNKGLKIGMDMILPTILILLGLTQAFQIEISLWPKWLIIKLVLVIAAVPMGIIAMRNKNKMLTIATIILFLSILVLAYTN